MRRRNILKNAINIILCIVVFRVAMLSLEVIACAGEPEAADLTRTTLVNISGGENSEFLKDQNSYTKKMLNVGTTITIENQEGIHGIYIIWEKSPGEWQLDVNGTSQTYGEYGFIHEYLELENSATSAVIHIPSGGAVIADISTFSAGVLPSWVQTWKPPYEKADMLVMPAHADDEHLFFGGTMPYYAGELGLKVQVVYLTNHWKEYARPHELLDGLWEAGITAYPIMGPFVDQYASTLKEAESLYAIDDVIKFQVEMIRRFKPKVIIAHDFNGEYGHGVHKLDAETLAKALELSNHADSYPESATTYGVWDVPKTYMHLYEKNQLTMNWDIRLDSFDGATAFDMAVRGMAKHKSQGTYFKVGRSGVFNCMLFGLYRSTVGEDVAKNDFFENVKVFRSYKYTRKSSIIPFDVQKEKKTISNAGVVTNAATNSAK